MEKSKWVAVITGVVSLLLGIAYLTLVQLLDMRGELIPAPMDEAVSAVTSGLMSGALGWIGAYVGLG